MKTAITADTLRKLPTGTCEIRDTKLPGLILRIQGEAKSWVFVYGRSKKVTLGRVDALTVDEARTLAKKVIGELANGKDPVAERRKQRAGTLDQFLTAHYEPWAVANLASGEETVKRIRSTFPADIVNGPMSKISTFAIERWRSQRRRDDIKDTTINRDLECLRGALAKAIEWKILDKHPLEDVRAFDTDDTGRVRWLSPDEEARLRAALAAREEAGRERRRSFNRWRAERGYKPLPEVEGYVDHLGPVVLLAMNTGLRRGEILKLTKPAVDLVRKQLTVRGTTAKTGKTRHVPLNAEAVQVLRDWLGQHRPHADAPWVFPSPTGEQMQDLKTAWGGLIDAAKIDDFTFHDLRHHFASRLTMSGVDLNVVRELLGHRDIKMTLRYAHLAPGHKAAAVEKLVASA